MSMPAPKPAMTSIPVQLCENEFHALILPPLSMPKRGPRGRGNGWEGCWWRGGGDRVDAHRRWQRPFDFPILLQAQGGRSMASLVQSGSMAPALQSCAAYLQR